MVSLYWVQVIFFGINQNEIKYKHSLNKQTKNWCDEIG